MSDRRGGGGGGGRPPRGRGDGRGRGPGGPPGPREGADERVIEAQAFILRDAKGRLRGSFALDDQDQPTLALYDEEEQPRLGLKVEDDGSASVDLLDEAGESGVGLRQTGEGRGLEVLAAGTTRLFIGLDGDAPTVDLYDGRGELRARLALNEDETHLVLLDEAGTERVVLLVGETGETAEVSARGGQNEMMAGLMVSEGDSSLLFTDEEGRPRTSLGTSAAGESVLAMTDAELQPRLALFCDDRLAAVELIDGEENTRALLGLTEASIAGISLHRADESAVWGKAFDAEGNEVPVDDLAPDETDD